MMDGLEALRAAIMGGREGEVKVDVGAGQIIIDGTPFPTTTPTAFKSKAGRKYLLLALWLEYINRDKSYIERVKAVREHGLDAGSGVLVTDSKALVEYLTGKVSTLEHALPGGGGTVAAAPTTPATPGAGVVGTAAAPALDDHAAWAEDHVWTLEHAIRAESQHKTRTNVLDVPLAKGGEGKFTSIRDVIFAKFEQHLGKGAAGGAGPNPPPGAKDKAVAGHKRPRSSMAAAPSPAAMEDKMAAFAGTPIIIVPSATGSLLTLYNAPKFLQHGMFVPSMEAQAAAAAAGQVKPSKVTITHTDSRGVTSRFHIIDDVSLLSRNDWFKVVAVFAQGAEWQFKGWKWGRTDDRPDLTPVEIFDRCVGAHVMYEGDVPHPNIPRWNVKVLNVSKTKRHLDSGVASQFWALVEHDLTVRKRYLLPKMVPGAVPVGGAANTV